MIRKIIPILIFSLFAIFLIGPTLSAKLGMIDDHEIAEFLGPTGKIFPWEIPSIVVSKTEIGQWGTYLRFRPSYYTVRVIESALWRDNASLWYGVRYLSLVATLVVGFVILRRYLPSPVSYLVIFYLMTLSFWPDILTRLGPSEIYALPACVIFVYGLIRNKPLYWFTGLIIAVGAKENFLVLLPIAYMWFVYQWGQKKIARTDAVYLTIATLYSLWIVAGIAIATGKTGTDVYGTQISYHDRVLTLWRYKRYIVESQHLIPSALAGIALVVSYVRDLFRKGYTSFATSRHAPYFLAYASLVLVVISQFIFYSNGLPTGMRYDLPGMVALRLLDVVSIIWIVSILPRNPAGSLVRFGLYSALILFAGIQIYRYPYIQIREHAAETVRTTTAFDTHLTTVADTLREHPTAPLVMTSDYYLDFEPIVSVSRYLRARGVTNPFMLDYRAPESLTDSLQHDLVPQLTAVSEKGATSPIFEYFSPNTHPTHDCYAITFGKELESRCEHAATF
jgi:hypothetical protein